MTLNVGYNLLNKVGATLTSLSSVVQVHSLKTSVAHLTPLSKQAVNIGTKSKIALYSTVSLNQNKFNPRLDVLNTRSFYQSSILLKKKKKDDADITDKPSKTKDTDKNKPSDDSNSEQEQDQSEPETLTDAIDSDSNSNEKAPNLKSARKALEVLETSVSKPTIPEEYPQILALPITRRPLFPGFYKAVVIKDAQVIAAIKELMKRGQPYIGAFMLKDDNLDVDTIESIDQIHSTGIFAQITSIFPSNSGEDNSLTAVLYPHRRIRMDSLINSKATEKSDKSEKTEESDKPKASETTEEAELDLTQESDIAQSTIVTSILENKFTVSIGNVVNLNDEPYNKRNPVIRAITTEMVSAFKDIAALNTFFRDQIANFSIAQYAGNVFDEPGKLADFAAAMSAGEPHEIQEVLESLVIEERLQKSLVLLKKELVNAQLQSKISKDVEAKIAKRQREYYLMEQLKGIKKELGLESDGKDKLVEQFRQRVSALTMPEDVSKVFDEEINKLAHLEPASSEFNVTRNYLDWITMIPWGKRSEENYNIPHARKVLDEDHYGLKDVKDRILEFIAVGKLRGTVEGKIICLSGPPGNSFNYY
jgi:Lon-like ATP-dependent protease